MSLKVMMDKNKSKVVFAEASSDVADALVSFLTLPLGKIVRILENHYGYKAPVIGSLTTLYRGLSNLDSSHFCVRGAKDMLLIPRSSFDVAWRSLKLDYTHRKPAQYFACQDSNCDRTSLRNLSMYCDVARCECGNSLNRELAVKGGRAGDGDGGFITTNALSFIITDDLRVAPIEAGFIQTLNNLGITDIGGADIRTLSFGINQIMELLKFSLISSTPLTDFIMSSNKKSFIATKPDPGILLDHFDKGVALESSKIVLKVYLQKSTNKFLFAQATDEFVELLLSFLTVPLGGVMFIFGENTCLRNFVNLSKSVSDFIDDKYFRTPDVKKRLADPKLAHGYINKNLFLPLTSEDSRPKLYYTEYWVDKERTKSKYVYDETGTGSLVWHISSIKDDQKNYVKKNAICYVTDDLTVSPSMVTIMSTLNSLGISLSEVKEMELQIGMEEVLRILKAALSSTTALTDAIINPMLGKLPKLQQPKQEC